MPKPKSRVAFLVAETFEDSELRIPLDRLREAGHEVAIVGLEADKAITGKRGKETIRVELAVGQLEPDDFDALVIPGGYSPDILRADADAVRFTRSMFDTGKPVAAICHGPWLLVEADAVANRKVTSWPSIKTDLVNAGATWVDQEVVEDEPLITSRNPDDLEAFCEAILRALDDATPSKRARAKVRATRPRA